MFFLLLFLILSLLVVSAYYGARRMQIPIPIDFKVEHLPHHRGLYVGLLVLLWCVPLLLLSVMLMREGPLGLLVLQHSEFFETLEVFNRDLLLTWLYGQIAGNGMEHLSFVPVDVLSRMEEDLGFYMMWWRVGSILSLFLVSTFVFMISYWRIRGGLRTRTHFENLVKKVFGIGSFVGVLTSFVIAFSLALEAWRFFYYVDIWDFLLGVNWEPQITFNDVRGVDDAFGLLPVLWGTLLISLISLVIAIPLGLLSAIYLNIYAGVRFRSVVKPLLELLAGVPTIVYGFVAVLIVAPMFYRLGDWLGFVSEPTNSLAAGSVMGMMLIPFISSFADDALNEVPLSMRYGSYALGATDAETMLRVMIPTAFPGIASGILLATSRAIGETMIVVMAAGLIARFAFSPFEGVTTMTVQIVAMLVGDTSFDSPKTLSAFALGITLFTLTLGLNFLAFWITSRFRRYVI